MSARNRRGMSQVYVWAFLAVVLVSVPWLVVTGTGPESVLGRGLEENVDGRARSSLSTDRFHGFSTGSSTLLNANTYSYLSVGADGGPAFGLEWLQHLSFDPGSPIWTWLASVGGASIPPGTYRKTTSWRTSFAVEQVVARDSESIVLGGHPSTHGVLDLTKYVIEHWTLDYPNGSPHLRRAISASPLGIPVAYSPPSLGVDVMPFAPCSTLGPPLESRSVVYSDPLLAATNVIAVDPDGRFILCGTSTGNLYQLPLNGSSGPNLIFTSTQVASLGGATMMHPRHHQTYGRIYIMPRGPLPPGTPDPAGDSGDYARSVLIDGDNDGVFDSVVEIPDMAWFTSDYGDYTLWVDGFDRNMW